MAEEEEKVDTKEETDQLVDVFVPSAVVQSAKNILLVLVGEEPSNTIITTTKAVWLLVKTVERVSKNNARGKKTPWLKGVYKLKLTTELASALVPLLEQHKILVPKNVKDVLFDLKVLIPEIETILTVVDLGETATCC